MVQLVSPPLPKGSGERTTSVTVRLTVAELDAVKRASVLAWRRQHSRWAREQLLAAAEPKRASAAEADQLLRATLRRSRSNTELVRIGSNLNQAVRAANTAALTAARTGQAMDVGRLTAAVEAARDELARLACDVAADGALS